MKGWLNQMALRQPLLSRNPSGSGGGPRISGDGSRRTSRWQGCSVVSLTVAASALLAVLTVMGIANLLLVSSDPLLSPQPPSSSSSSISSASRSSRTSYEATRSSNAAHTTGSRRELKPPKLTTAATRRSFAPAAARVPPMARQQGNMKHQFSNLQHIYTLPLHDTSPRCQHTGICDGDHSCGPDGLGCVTSAKERQQHVRKAIAWSWEGYRKYAWGQDEVDVVHKSAKVWFNLGLTIVDSLDTLMIAGLREEYQQARHWVANHLEFKAGSKVQFFEVNIRLLGGLLSAYYLSDGDEVYLHKAQQLADRLMVAFNTSTGIPNTFVKLLDAADRSKDPIADVKSNLAEAGTISMEFTTIGRLLGRDDMFDAGMHFWYILMGSRNFSGLYCMGINTRDGDCTDAKLTIGSAADSMYEYMLKQWVLSGGTQQVPLTLYKEAMQGVRKHLVRQVHDGTAEMSFVSEATVNKGTGVVALTNDRFEHLTCFAGGMFVLGNLHNTSTNTSFGDLDDVTLGARIGRACYELYHQTPSGIAPDSVHYQRQAGGDLPDSVPLPKRRLLAHPVNLVNQQRMSPGSSVHTLKHLRNDPFDVLRQLLRRKGASNKLALDATQQRSLQELLTPNGGTGRRVLQAPSAEPLATAPAAAHADKTTSPSPAPLVASWTQISKADFLRPETAETLFYLWRATGDEIYREWGWNMFRAFERYCRLDSGGYATAEDVNLVPPKLGNKMESFWLAETLKYFYLLFEDDPNVLPLDQWVFNTEAHPLPVWGTAPDVQAMQRMKQRHQAVGAHTEAMPTEQGSTQQHSSMPEFVKATSRLLRWLKHHL